MKKVTITCDYCKNEIFNEHIEIGSESGQDFHFKNTILGSNRKMMSSYDDLHFCSDKHFVNFFLATPKQ